MKIYVSESVNGVTFEETVTILEVQDFDTGAGAIPLSVIEANGDIIVGTGVASVDVVHSSGASVGDVLTLQSSGLPAYEAPSGGVANALDFQARLTLESGVPVSTSNQTAKTAVYLTPYNGNKVGVYDTSWERYNLTEISIKLTDAQNGNTANGSAVVTGLTNTSQFIVGMEVTGTGIAGSSTIASIDSATQVTLNNNATADGTGVALTFKVAASTVLDIFLTRIGSTNKLEMVAWTDATTRATALTTQDGVLVKSGDPTFRYVGTICTTATAGQVEDSGGLRLVWNMYNRIGRRIYAALPAAYTQTNDSYLDANGNTTYGQGKVGFVGGFAANVHTVWQTVAKNSSTGAFYIRLAVSDGTYSAVSVGGDVLRHTLVTQYLNTITGFYTLQKQSADGGGATSTFNEGDSNDALVGWIIG